MAKIRKSQGEKKKGVGAILFIGEIKVNLIVSPKGAEFVLECAPAKQVLGTELEDLLIRGTQHLTKKIRQWEEHSDQATEIKVAGLVAAGFGESLK